jgi:hypothetical protein
MESRWRCRSRSARIFWLVQMSHEMCPQIRANRWLYACNTSQIQGFALGCRSRSARIFWLVQMSYEMWEYAPDGETYYERFLSFAKASHRPMS